jgi:hypothetical protein
MLRIEKESDAGGTRLLLSLRIQSDGIACIRSAMSDGCERTEGRYPSGCHGGSFPWSLRRGGHRIGGVPSLRARVG